MRIRMIVALILATALVGPATAQPSDNERGGIRTETMSRLSGGDTGDLMWNILGLFGILGVWGIRGEHAEDSYHPAPIE